MAHDSPEGLGEDDESEMSALEFISLTAMAPASAVVAVLAWLHVFDRQGGNRLVIAVPLVIPLILVVLFWDRVRRSDDGRIAVLVKFTAFFLASCMADILFLSAIAPIHGSYCC